MFGTNEKEILDRIFKHITGLEVETPKPVETPQDKEKNPLEQIPLGKPVEFTPNPPSQAPVKR